MIFVINHRPVERQLNDTFNIPSAGPIWIGKSVDVFGEINFVVFAALRLCAN